MLPFTVIINVGPTEDGIICDIEGKPIQSVTWMDNGKVVDYHNCLHIMKVRISR